MPTTIDIAKTAMDKKVLATIELLLYAQADLIDALLRDGVQFTKMLAPPPTGGQ